MRARQPSWAVRFRLAARVVLGSWLLALAGCRTVEVDVARPIELGPDPTYAWMAEMWGDGPGDEEIGRRAKAALDARLRAAGLRPVTPGRAGLLLEHSVRVETRKREFDPYFSQWLVERYEVGVLELVFHHPKTLEPLWTGRSEAELRATERGMGWTRVRMEPTGEERRWPLEAMADDIVSRLMAAQP